MRLAVALALVGLTLAGLAVAPGATTARSARAQAGEEPFRVLVFTRTTGFRHASIPVAISAIESLGDENGFDVDATEDPAAFTGDNLSRYALVMFVNTTGNILDETQRTDLEAYVRGGGGYMGVHSAADSEYSWPFYEQLVGARFKSHPVQQTGGFKREDGAHPATAHYPERFDVFDELYSFTSSPRPRVHVLLSVDESTYEQDPNTTDLAGKPETGVMGDHPMAWCHTIGRGRSFYTALGHEPYLYATDAFRRHLLGGIRTAAGRQEADCSTPDEAAAPRLRLTARCLPDGRVKVRVRGAATRVRIKLGKRVVGRRRAVLGPRAVGRRVRAVALVAGGRKIVRLKLPRC